MADALTLLFVPMMLAVGLFSVYEDVRFGRVRNSLVVFSIAYALLMPAVLLFFPSQHNAIRDALPAYALNFLFSFFLCLMLWLMRLWPAGDAKLFLACSALLPSTIFPAWKIAFPGLILLLNIFVPYVLYYAARVLLKSTWQMKTHAVKGLLIPQRIASFALLTFAFSWVGGKFSSFMVKHSPEFSNPVTTTLFVIALTVVVKDIYSLGLRRLCFGIMLFAILFDFGYVSTSPFIASLGITLLLIFFFRGFLLSLGHSILSIPVYIENLKPGMVPAENIQMDNAGEKSRKIGISAMGSLAAKSPLWGKSLIERPHEGLEEGTIKNIQKLHSEDKILFHTLRIYEHVPFAPFLFLGAMFTLLTKGQFIIFFL